MTKNEYKKVIYKKFFKNIYTNKACIGLHTLVLAHINKSIDKNKKAKN